MTTENIDGMIERRNALLAKRRTLRKPLAELDDARMGLLTLTPAGLERRKKAEAEDDRLFNEVEDLNDMIWSAPMTSTLHLVEKVSILHHQVRMGVEVSELVTALWALVRPRVGLI